MNLTIISGGQTGSDRGGLLAALELKYPIGGWCPKGRRAEDGAIPEKFPLKETASTSYTERTKLNVRDSDATLILFREALGPGSAQTQTLCNQLRKPCRPIDLAQDYVWTYQYMMELVTRMRLAQYKIINIAGTRESKSPGIQEKSYLYLLAVLSIRSGLG